MRAGCYPVLLHASPFPHGKGWRNDLISSHIEQNSSEINLSYKASSFAFQIKQPLNNLAANGISGIIPLEIPAAGLWAGLCHRVSQLEVAALGGSFQ